MTSTENKKSPYNNLTKKELEALEELKRRDDIIIASADKGVAISYPKRSTMY